MNDENRQRLTRRELWMRAPYMLFFLIAYSVAEIVLTLVVVFQFFMVLVTGRAHEAALILGGNLSAYVYQVFRYQTFNSETPPFPFDEWPDEPLEGNPWREDFPAGVVDEPDDETGPQGNAGERPVV